jgi:hypothetical protein
MGVMEGWQISKAKYFNYHSIESEHWNGSITIQDYSQECG